MQNVWLVSALFLGVIGLTVIAKRGSQQTRFMRLKVKMPFVKIDYEIQNSGITEIDIKANDSATEVAKSEVK